MDGDLGDVGQERADGGVHTVGGAEKVGNLVAPNFIRDRDISTEISSRHNVEVRGGCSVIAYNRSTITDGAIDEQVTLEELLKRSDIISLHCPLTSETKNLIGKSALALMKKHAILINTARGGVVDSAALADALREGTIAGAACDVFEIEPPLPLNHPLLHSPNTIVTPHIAFASKESMELRAEIVFENLYSWLNGKQVNRV